MTEDHVILRWRIHEGTLPLRRRHLRALKTLELPEPLLGWIHERLEWALLNMLKDDSEAVLVLDIDPAAEVKLTLEDLRAAPHLCAADIDSQDDLAGDLTVDLNQGGEKLTGSIWLERDGGLFASTSQIYRATDTLCYDLAKTLGHEPTVQPQTLETVELAIASGNVFFISDEFGFLPIWPGPDEVDVLTISPLVEKLRAGFSKLWR